MRGAALALALVIVAPVMSGCLGGTGDDDGDALEPNAAVAGRGPGFAEPTTYDRVGDDRVRIHWDAHGVPHIYADDEEALFWGLGFAQATDRLFQLELFRRAGKGRLAEVLGEAMLPMDQTMRLMGRSEEQRWQAFDELEPRDQEAFRAYADGINQAMAEALTDPAKLPLELAGLVDLMEPWTVTDSMAVAELALGGFGEFGGDELTNAQLLMDLEAAYGEDEAWRIFNDAVWLDDPGQPTSIQAEDLAYDPPAVVDVVPPAQRGLLDDGVLGALAGADARLVALDRQLRAVGLPNGLGSNAILIAGDHTASGRPLLLAGPQTGHSVPSFWWEASLHGAGFDIEGVGVPGTGGLVIGRTGNAAWTVTSGYSDTVDIFVEELDPGDPTRYRTGDGLVDMDHRIETYLVRPNPTGATDGTETTGAPRIEVQNVYRTHHGPVLAVSDDERHAITRAAIQRDAPIASLLCWVRLGQSTVERGYPAFRDCMHRLTSNFNLFYADDTGTIAYHHAGLVPIRTAGLDPRLPLPGDGSAEWQRTVPPTEMPQVVNPSRGWLVNWNNAPAPGWSDGDQRHAWSVAHRGRGLERLVGELVDERSGAITLDDVAAINQQAARSDVHADLFRPVLVSAAPGPARDAMVAWIDAGAPIRDDDGDGRVDDDAVAAFEAFHIALAEAVLDDEGLLAYLPAPSYPTGAISGNADSHGGSGAITRLVVKAVTGHTAAELVDDRSTKVPERAGDVVAAALATADEALAQGRPMMLHAFAPLGAATAETIPRMNRGSFNMLAELTTPPTAVTVLPPGNSGFVPALTLAGLQEPAPHVDDQVSSYAGFAYKPTPFTVPQVEAVAERTLELDVVRGVELPARVPAEVRALAELAGLPTVSVLGDVST